MIRSATLATIALALLPLSSRGQGNDCQSDAATRQSVVGFSSVVDGQPGTAGQSFVGLVSAFNEDGSSFVASYNFTPGARREVCDALLGISAPAYQAGHGDGGFDSAFGLSWEQRWRADDSNGPTLSTLVALSIPYEGDDRKVDATVVLVVARSFGRGTAYLNLVTAS